MRYSACVGWARYLIKRLTPGAKVFPDQLERISGIEGNECIKSLLGMKTPFLVGRMGSTEMRNLAYIRGVKFDLRAPSHLEIESGIFPGNFRTAERFVEELENAIREVDVLISFHWASEGYLRHYLKNGAVITEPRALEPYLLPGKGWWHALHGKRVLIVNSFASFLKERLTRETLLKLWPQEREHVDKILPADIVAINTPYGWEGDIKSEYKSYSDVLDVLKDQILKTDYDVALIACGGYGLPLAAWVKAQGKQAIHVGGVLQVWGGVKGKRFMTQKPWLDIDKTHWVEAPASTRPSSTEYAVGSYW